MSEWIKEIRVVGPRACVFCGDHVAVPRECLAPCGAVGCAHRQGMRVENHFPVCHGCYPYVVLRHADESIINVDYVRCPWHLAMSDEEKAASRLEREKGRFGIPLIFKANTDAKLLEQVKQLVDRGSKRFGAIVNVEGHDDVLFLPQTLPPTPVFANRAGKASIP